MIYGRIVIYAAIGLALAAGGWKCYTAGQKSIQAAWTAEKLEQTQKLVTFNENQRLIERAWQNQSTKAQNERSKKQQDLQLAIAASRTELDGLRGDIYSLATSSSGQPANACSVRAATTSRLLEQCATAYTDVAKAASGHAADSLMYQQAWPK